MTLHKTVEIFFNTYLHIWFIISNVSTSSRIYTWYLNAIFMGVVMDSRTVRMCGTDDPQVSLNGLQLD